MFWFFDWEAFVIVVPWPGIEPSPPALEGKVSTTGPSGKSLGWVLMLRIAAAAAKLLQSCPTLCDPIDGSPPGSPVPGILQARRLEWVAISFSNAWKWKVKGKLLSRVRLLATPWTTAYQAPPSMGCSRQEYWSGVPLPSPDVADYFISNMCFSFNLETLFLCITSRIDLVFNVGITPV